MASSSPSSTTLPSVSISSAFDGGNGKLKDVISTTPNSIECNVEIEKDPFTYLENTHHFQYFNFRSSVKGIKAATDTDSDGPTTVKFNLSNAGEASYTGGWKGGFTVFYTSTDPSDPNSWKRKLDTSYNEETGDLTWTHTFDKSSSAYFSYFPPFSYERHLSLLAKCQASPNATVESLGQTLDGREMECCKVGNGDKIAWIIHRQHPGENMAEFYAEGLLNRLLGLDNAYSVDGMTRNVLDMYTFYVVPNMNPDGSVRGHLRTNAGGQNLNREWCPSTKDSEDGTSEPYDAPTLERSPEVLHVLKKMDETGVDVFLDVHGDEALPFNFLAGGEGCPNWSKRLETLHGAFLGQYSRVNSDMQVPVGYETETPGQGRMNVCSNQITNRFNCLSATLEMPFKDCMSNPDPERGWNPARAMMLGASVLEPLFYVGPYLRISEDELAETNCFVTGDEYVKPTEKY